MQLMNADLGSWAVGSSCGVSATLTPSPIGRTAVTSLRRRSFLRRQRTTLLMTPDSQQLCLVLARSADFAIELPRILRKCQPA